MHIVHHQMLVAVSCRQDVNKKRNGWEWSKMKKEEKETKPWLCGYFHRREGERDSGKTLHDTKERVELECLQNRIL